MNTIWKFPLHDSMQSLSLPAATRIVRVALQNGVPTLWGVVEKGTAQVERTFRVVGTGEEFDDRWKYVGSCDDGPYVWHVLYL